MRIISLVLIVVLAAMAKADEDLPRSYNLNEAPQLFEKFVKDYNKQYKDDADRQLHYDRFLESLKEINQLNADHPYTTFGINEFTDFTEEQMSHMYGFNPEH